MLVAKSRHRQSDLMAKMWQVIAAHVAQLHSLQIVPNAVVRIQIWSIAWQLLQMNTLGTSRSEKRFDRLAAMDRRAIPDHQQLPLDVVQHVPEKADYIWSLHRVLLHRHQQPAVKRNGADCGQMVMRQKYLQDWCLFTWRIGPKTSRQQIEARFIYPSNGSAFFLGLFLRAGQRSVSHSWIAASLRWIARCTGFCGVQPISCRSRLT